MVGILAGLAAVTRVMASTLFRVSAIDAATFVAVPGVLARVAFAATAIPALRAPGWILSLQCEKNSPPEPPMPRKYATQLKWEVTARGWPQSPGGSCDSHHQ